MTLFWARGSLPGCASSRRSKPSPGLMRPTLQSDCFGAGSKSVVGSRMDLGNGKQEGCKVHDANPLQLQKQKHQIRQQWRHEDLFRWATGRRHEAAALRGALPAAKILQELHSSDLDWIRLHADRNAESRSVLLGAVASFGWLAKARGQPEDDSCACAWCHRSLGDWLHLAWECPAASNRHTRPANLDDGSKPDLDGQL